jgi:hypothetical protein
MKYPKASSPRAKSSPKLIAALPAEEDLTITTVRQEYNGREQLLELNILSFLFLTFIFHCSLCH